MRTLKTLTDNGVRLSALTRCIDNLRQQFDRVGGLSLSEMRLVTDGKNVFRYVPEKDHLVSLDIDGQFAFAFGLGNEVHLLMQKAEKLDRNSRYVRTGSRYGIKTVHGG